MYGTVAHMRVKAGQQDDLVKLIGEWNAERRPKISGAVSGYMVKLDSDPSRHDNDRYFREQRDISRQRQ